MTTTARKEKDVILTLQISANIATVEIVAYVSNIHDVCDHQSFLQCFDTVGWVTDL